MGDTSISIVPRKSVFPNRENKAEEIVQWLVSIDVVKPTPSDCILGSSNGYPISDGAKFVVTEPEYLPFSFWTNGLEVIIERQVFDTAQNGMEELICPNCKQDISNEDWDFLNEWSDNISNNLTCPLCHVPTAIHSFVFSPPWGFSDLGFRFWNWPPFADNFIETFRQKLDCDIDIVFAKI